MREFVPAIYNITVKVPDGVPNPTFGGFFQRTKSSVRENEEEKEDPLLQVRGRRNKSKRVLCTKCLV